MVMTRPDLAFALSLLSRYQSNPSKEHMRLAKRLLRYVQGTKTLGITYGTDPSMKLTGSTDSDFAGTIDGRQSYRDYLFSITGKPVS